MIKRNPPLVDQVKLEMLSQIQAGTLVDANGQLPSEASLAHQFSVSRSTTREALAQLAMAGIIIRRHGKGNFLRVSPSESTRPFWSWLDLSPSFMDLIRLVGYKPRCELLNRQTYPAGLLAPILSIPEEGEIFVFERIFYADDKPFIHSTTSVPLELIMDTPVLTGNAEDLNWQSIYQILERYTQYTAHHQVCEIRAVKADEKLSEAFREYFGEPILRLEEVGYNEEEKPLFHAINRFRGDLVAFRMQRNPNVTILGSNP